MKETYRKAGLLDLAKFASTLMASKQTISRPGAYSASQAIPQSTSRRWPSSSGINEKRGMPAALTYRPERGRCLHNHFVVIFDKNVGHCEQRIQMAYAGSDTH